MCGRPTSIATHIRPFEHKTLVADGAEATYTLRVTHIYRREDGCWRIVHRHGDRPPT